MFRPLLAAACLLSFGLIGLVPAQAAKGKKYALLVGVTEYRHASLSPLKYTENDVEGLAQILEGKTAGFAEVRVLTVARGKKRPKLDAPTRANIEKALEELLAKKGRDDTVLVALSGHGVQLDVEDPEGKRPSNTYRYFCPSDADFAKISYSTGSAPSLVLLDDVMRRLGECGAGTKLILVDACRSSSKATSATRKMDVQNVTIPVGVGAMFSCKSGEVAWETEKLGKGHGVFFHYVLEGLRGKAGNEKGEVRWSRLNEYVTDRVSEDVPKLIGDGARQTPHAVQNLVGATPVLARGLAPAKAGPTGEAEVWYRKGRDLMHGLNGETIHRVRAEEYLKKAAERKHSLAIAALGRCFAMPVGLAPTREEQGNSGSQAIAAGLEKLAAEGNAEALVELGHACLAPLHIARRADRKSERRRCHGLFKQAADLGSVEGLWMLGHCHAVGPGLGAAEKNAAEEVRLTRLAAEKGLAAAQHRLSTFYQGRFSGKEIGVNEKESLRWLQAAAAQHYPFSLYALGNRHLSGDGVQQNETKAADLFRLAADQRHRAAEHMLGYCLLEGRGVKKNEKLALEWYEKSAKGGYQPAVLALGKLYAAGGSVVKKDEKKALEWLGPIAGDRNSVAKEAKALVDKLKKK